MIFEIWNFGQSETEFKENWKKPERIGENRDRKIELIIEHFGKWTMRRHEYQICEYIRFRENIIINFEKKVIFFLLVDFSKSSIPRPKIRLFFCEIFDFEKSTF